MFLSQADLFTYEGSVSEEKSQNCVSSYISGSSKLDNETLLSIINSNGKQVERVTNRGDEVDSYRNLNKPEFFSFKQRKEDDKGKVSGYGKVVVLSDAVFKVSESSRQRVIKQGSRNVHAYVRGCFENCFDGVFTPDESFLCVTYNPYFKEWFFERESGNLLDKDLKCKEVVLFGANVYLRRE